MLTQQQIAFYRENGYLILDDLYTAAEIEECSTEYDALFARKRESNLEATWQGDWREKANVVETNSVFALTLTFTPFTLFCMCVFWGRSFRFTTFKIMLPFSPKCCSKIPCWMLLRV